MARKKKIEEKTEFNPEAMLGMTEMMMEKYLTKMLGSTSLVKALKEFGISGFRLLEFLSRVVELDREYGDNYQGSIVDEAMEDL